MSYCPDCAKTERELATTREIARELAEALESVTTWAGRDNRRLSLSWADKIHSLNVASAAINKARAAGILNAPEACRCGHSKEQHDGHTFQPGSTPPNHCSACRCAAYLPPARSLVVLTPCCLREGASEFPAT